METNTPVLKPDALYIGDGGRCFCGRHAGAAARYTGRDISGQVVVAVDEVDRTYCRALGYGDPECRRCADERRDGGRP